MSASQKLAFMSVLFFFICCGPGKEAPRQPSPVSVSAARVVQKDVPVNLRSIGTVEASQTISVRSLVAGEILRIDFREGQDVKKGDLLFVIDPRPIEAALKQAEANLQKDIAQQKFAVLEKDRYATLAARGLIAREQADQMRTQAETLTETVKADRAIIDNYRLQLKYCYIRSPINGRTGAVLVNLGNIVKVNDTILVVVNQVEPVTVSFTIPERDLAEVKKYQGGRKLTVTALAKGDDQPCLGLLYFIDNTVDPATGTIRLKAEFPNRERRLWPGAFVNVIMTLATRQGAIVIPTQALQAGQEGQFVFVVKEDSTVESRSVIVDFAIEGESVISKGVSPGEMLVTDGQLNLVPGRKVIINPPAGQKGQNG
jgi:membrane fusion protein, multidrug efflux system